MIKPALVLMIVGVLALSVSLRAEDEGDEEPNQNTAPTAADAARTKGFKAEEANPPPATDAEVAAPIERHAEPKILYTAPPQRPLGAAERRAAGLGRIVSGTAASPPPGSDAFSFDNIAIPAISKVPKKTTTHGGLNGAGQYVNAYAMDPARCNTSPPLRRSWQHNIDVADFKTQYAAELFSMLGDEALTYKFTIPMTIKGGSFFYIENSASNGAAAPTFMSVSATPCDFDNRKIGSVTSPTRSCYQVSGANNLISWTIVSGRTVPTNYCQLKPGQTYYLNIRFADGATSTPTCPIGRRCGGSLSFN